MSQEKTPQYRKSDDGSLFAQNIKCAQKTTTQFTRERAYTNRAKLLDGLSLQFFSPIFLPPFAKGESGKFFHTEGASDTELRST